MNSHKSLIFAGVFLLALSKAESSTIISTDFSDATVGSYSSGSTIVAGLVAAAPTGYTTQVASLNGRNVLEFTDNSTTSPTAIGAGAYLPITYDSANPVIAGSLSFTPLLVASSSAPNFQFALNSGGVHSTSSTVSSVMMELDGDGTALTFRNGNTLVTALTNLAMATYTVDFTADYSTYKWSFTVSSEGSVLYDSTSLTGALLDMRSHTIPDVLLLTAGSQLTAAKSSPFIAVNSIDVSAVPEPGTWVLLAAGIPLLLAYSRSRLRRIQNA